MKNSHNEQSPTNNLHLHNVESHIRHHSHQAIHINTVQNGTLNKQDKKMFTGKPCDNRHFINSIQLETACTSSYQVRPRRCNISPIVLNKRKPSIG